MVDVNPLNNFLNIPRDLNPTWSLKSEINFKKKKIHKTLLLSLHNGFD